MPRKAAAFLLAAVAATGCSALRGRDRAPAPKTPNPAEAAMARALDHFARGREAALSGDFTCARDHFAQAIESAPSARSGAAADPALVAFSIDLYDGILRYEALAGPTEEAGNVDGKVSPELEGIESPRATQEAITHARESITSDKHHPEYDIPIVINEPVLRLLAAFQGKFAGVISRGLSRSGRYMPMIHRIFEEEGLPKDLAQVALIESSFLTNAHSPMQAHGIWQFMPRTGRQYGLSSNAIVDERSDPEKSTRAAARHLSYLHELFGDWYLAMAAYNAGEGKIIRAMQRTGAKDFWQLAATGAIRPQTVNYVPAVIAATLIAHNPLHYGIDVAYESPLEYETVYLDRPVQLRHLADGDEASLDELKRLNPELRAAVVPRQPEGYALKIPVGTRPSILMAYAAAPTAVFTAPKRHVVRRGETLARIAKRHRVSVTALASANSISRKATLKRGRVLVVPGRSVVQTASVKKTKSSPRKETRVAAAPKRKAPASRSTKSYRVSRGDTLYRIALRHGTTVARILAVNSLPPRATIRPGDRIKIPSRTR
ncbi:MAG: LysM peptidoglycan-binding domain-containing protein [Thermoanaerobaculia bacterium]